MHRHSFANMFQSDLVAIGGERGGEGVLNIYSTTSNEKVHEINPGTKRFDAVLVGDVDNKMKMFLNILKIKIKILNSHEA